MIVIDNSAEIAISEISDVFSKSKNVQKFKNDSLAGNGKISTSTTFNQECERISRYDNLKKYP